MIPMPESHKKLVRRRAQELMDELRAEGLDVAIVMFAAMTPPGGQKIPVEARTFGWMEVTEGLQPEAINHICEHAFESAKKIFGTTGEDNA